MTQEEEQEEQEKPPKYVCLDRCGSGFYKNVDVRGTATVGANCSGRMKYDEEGNEVDDEPDYDESDVETYENNPSLSDFDMDDWEEYEKEVYCEDCGKEAIDTEEESCDTWEDVDKVIAKWNAKKL